MQYNYEAEIKLDEFGRPDIDYYTREAKKLRSEAFKTLFPNLLQWLKRLVSHHHVPPMRSAH